MASSAQTRSRKESMSCDFSLCPFFFRSENQSSESDTAQMKSKCVLNSFFFLPVFLSFQGLTHGIWWLRDPGSFRLIQLDQSLQPCFCLYSEGGVGKRVQRRYKLLLKSLGLEMGPITSAYTLLQRIQSHGHASVQGMLGEQFWWKDSGLSHPSYFSALVGIFLGGTNDLLTFPFSTPSPSCSTNKKTSSFSSW